MAYWFGDPDEASEIMAFFIGFFIGFFHGILINEIFMGLLVGFYVLVIFDFDGDFNGISCLFYVESKKNAFDGSHKKNIIPVSRTQAG